MNLMPRLPGLPGKWSINRLLRRQGDSPSNAESEYDRQDDFAPREDIVRDPAQESASSSTGRHAWYRAAWNWFARLSPTRGPSDPATEREESATTDEGLRRKTWMPSIALPHWSFMRFSRRGAKRNEKQSSESDDQAPDEGESQSEAQSQGPEKGAIPRFRIKLPTTLMSKWDNLTSFIDDLLGPKKKEPETPPITDEFLESLTIEEAIALLEAEMAEEEASRSEITESEQRPSAPRQFQYLTERVNELVQKRTMTLTVEGEIVRIVIFQGREVIAWGTANPEQDPLRGLEMGVMDEDYPSRLEGLLAELQLRRLRVVTDLPLYTPLMRHFRLPKIPKRYLDSVIISEVLESVPFSQEEVDVPWQIKKADERDEVFALAVPKKAIDEHVDLLKQMNVQPSAAYSRATALAFSAGVSDAVVLHLAPGQASIVLIQNRAAQMVHRLELSWDYSNVEIQADAVVQAVEQVMGYYEAPDTSSEATSLPVIITGQLVDEAPLAEAVKEGLPYEVLPFMPPIEYPEHFVPQEYAVNIGLAISDWSRSKTRRKISRQKSPTITLLSERHLPKPLPVWPAATFITLLMFGVMALSLTSQVNSAEVEAGALSTRLSNLERQERRMRLTQGQARAVQERIASVDLFTEDLETQLAILRQDKELLLLRAEAMTHEALPPNVSINSISDQGQGFAISGIAGTYEDALQYTANLRETVLFSEVKVTRLSGGGPTSTGEVNFSVKITIDPQFLPDVDEEDDTEETDGLEDGLEEEEADQEAN